MGRIRAADRELCDQNRYPSGTGDEGEYRQLPAAAQDAGILVRLGSRAGDDGRGIRALDAVDIPAAVYYSDIQITTSNGKPLTIMDISWEISQDVSRKEVI